MRTWQHERLLNRPQRQDSLRCRRRHVQGPSGSYLLRPPGCPRHKTGLLAPQPLGVVLSEVVVAPRWGSCKTIDESLFLVGTLGGVTNEESVLEEAMDNLREAAQRIRATQNVMHARGMTEEGPKR